MALAAMAAPSLCAQEVLGRIEGQVLGPDKRALAGASVILRPAAGDKTLVTQFSGPDGQFAFRDLPAASYSLTVVLGEGCDDTRDVAVAAGAAAVVTIVSSCDNRFTENLVVHGALRQPERLVDAPAPVALLDADDIGRKAPLGQVPTVLEYTPGAQVTQAGIWDFNMGTRGFNRALSRRVAVLLDGRDVSLPFFGYQGWGAFSMPLDDLSSVEFLRGPSAALYGANASGGVVSLTSKEPRFSLGGNARVAVGERDSLNVDARWAMPLAENWYARVVGGVRAMDSRCRGWTRPNTAPSVNRRPSAIAFRAKASRSRARTRPSCLRASGSIAISETAR
jgi:outer membrane cobalamin receptor